VLIAVNSACDLRHNLARALAGAAGHTVCQQGRSTCEQRLPARSRASAPTLPQRQQGAATVLHDCRKGTGTECGVCSQ